MNNKILFVMQLIRTLQPRRFQNPPVMFWNEVLSFGERYNIDPRRTLEEYLKNSEKPFIKAINGMKFVYLSERGRLISTKRMEKEITADFNKN